MVKKKVTERKQLLWRLLVAIVSGIILCIWKILIGAIVIVQVFIILFKNKKKKSLAEFCEYWNTESYIFMKYLTFVSNEKPFPFNDLKRLSKVEK